MKIAKSTNTVAKMSYIIRELTSLAIAIAVLPDDSIAYEPYVDEVRSTFLKRRKFLVTQIRKIDNPMLDQAADTLFVIINKARCFDDIRKLTLQKGLFIQPSFFNLVEDYAQSAIIQAQLALMGLTTFRGVVSGFSFGNYFYSSSELYIDTTELNFDKPNTVIDLLIQLGIARSSIYGLPIPYPVRSSIVMERLSNGYFSELPLTFGASMLTPGLEAVDDELDEDDEENAEDAEDETQEGEDNNIGNQDTPDSEPDDNNADESKEKDELTEQFFETSIKLAKDETLDDVLYKMAAARYITQLIDSDEISGEASSILQTWYSCFLFIADASCTKDVLNALKIKLK